MKPFFICCLIFCGLTTTTVVLASNFTDYEKYFHLHTAQPLYIPNNKSKKLPVHIARKLAKSWNARYAENQQGELFAEGKIIISNSITGYILREPSCYGDSREIRLYVIDNNSHRVHSRISLSDECYDAGYGEESHSWLVDLNNDNYLDIVKKHIELESDFKDIETFSCTNITVDTFIYNPKTKSFNQKNLNPVKSLTPCVRIVVA